jgi:hypothetical protein
MAMGWLTVLKMVPWSDVISNAPVVADGAKKLWSAVAKKSAEPTPMPDAETAPDPDALNLAALQARLAVVEATAAGLHQQMLASTELIQSLAEQNTQLIQRMAAERARLAWLALVTLLLGLGLVAHVLWPGIGA